MRYWLTACDVTGIQSYIFGSNRLAENLGASHLVAEALGSWLREALPQPTAGAVQRLEEDPQLASELLYAGGGNALVLCRDEAAGQELAAGLSRLVLQRAPGLDVAIYGRAVEFAQLDVEAAAVLAELAVWKRRRPRSQPLLGLGVTAECRTTRLPAVGLATDAGGGRRLASAESLAKHAAADAAQQRLQRHFGEPSDGRRWSREFAKIAGTRDEMNYLAVVHADGNGLGDRVARVGQGAGGRAYVEAIRAFSEAVNRAGLEALKATVRRLSDWLAHAPAAAAFALRDFPYLPFRPLVYGGDDVTFVCDGRLGLALARIYLDEFAQAAAQLPDGGGPATACAGVAVVKVSYPFARAYGLAEELCRHAKDERSSAGSAESWLDWHFAQAGLGGTLQQIRARQYTVAAGQLCLRPVELDAGWRSWQTVRDLVAGFADERRWPRNKLKALQVVLREGASAVGQFLQLQALPGLPEVVAVAGARGGWHGQRCLHHDAIEAMEYFLGVDA
ncbi:MAG: hypothetical protein IT204_15300 [Fimbriimonadaceae bacterium]|nr:hypothetical protein [Fimbriimonadaceae bacterium]